MSKLSREVQDALSTSHLFYKVKDDVIELNTERRPRIKIEIYLNERPRVGYMFLNLIKPDDTIAFYDENNHLKYCSLNTDCLPTGTAVELIQFFANHNRNNTLLQYIADTDTGFDAYGNGTNPVLKQRYEEFIAKYKSCPKRQPQYFQYSF